MKQTTLVAMAIACLACVLFAGKADAAVSLDAQTSLPHTSIYIPGEAVPITITATGLAKSEKPLVLHIKTVDEQGAPIAAKDIPVPASSGTWTTTYQAPHERLGFYRTYIALSDGVAIPALGSRGTGYITYCVVPDPATRTIYPPDESRFGMQGGFNMGADTAPYLGFHWVNGPGSWGQNEPDHPGQFAETRAKDVAAGKTGPLPGGYTRRYPFSYVKGGKTLPWPIYPVFGLNKAPDWAFKPGTMVGSTAPLLPSALPAWDAYCRAFAKSVTEDYPDLPVHFYQVTWEPNYFKGTVDQFVTIYKIAYTALHAADPKAFVVGPTKSGVGDFGMPVEARWFDDGFGSYIDGYTIHPYIGMPAEEHNFIEKLHELIMFARDHAKRDIPIYSTEQGDAEGGDPTKDLAQARNLVRGSLITLGEGCKFYFMFYMHDFPKNDYGYFYNLYPDLHFGSDRLSPKPIAPAFAAETYLLDGHDSLGALDYLGPTSLGYAFQRGDDIVLALWDYGKTPHTVSIDTGVKSVQVYDWMGNSRTVATPNGKLSVDLTQDPIYVRGVAADLYGKDAPHMLVVTSSRITTMPGAQISLDGSLNAPAGSALNGVLTVGDLSGSKSVDVAAGAAQPLHLTASLPAVITPGLHVLPVTLTLTGGKTVVRHVAVTIGQPIDVEAVIPNPQSDVQSSATLAVGGVRISLANLLATPFTGTVSLTTDGISGGPTVPFLLMASSNAMLIAPWPELSLQAGKTYAVTATVKTDSGYSFTKQFMLGAERAGRVADPAGWPASGAPLALGSGTMVKLGWDQNALYIAVTTPTAGATVTPSLQIGVNLDPGQVERSTGDIPNDLKTKRRFSVLTLRPTSAGPEANRTFTNIRQTMPKGLLAASDLPLKIVANGTSTTYDARIPWSTLGAQQAPPVGSAIGFALDINEVAGPTLFGGIAPTPDSDQLGYLILSQAP